MINATTPLFVTHSAHPKAVQTSWKQLCFRCLIPSGGTALVEQTYDDLSTRRRAIIKDKNGSLLIQLDMNEA